MTVRDIVQWFVDRPGFDRGVREVMAGRCGCGCGRPLERLERTVDVADVIRGEEEKYLKTLERNENRIKQLLTRENVLTLTGDALCRLHHTHGIDPDQVMAVLGVELPKQAMVDYRAAWERHCDTGTKGALRETTDVAIQP